MAILDTGDLNLPAQILDPWLGRVADARTAYRAALELVPTQAERRFLERRIAELDPTRTDKPQ